jgi:hypothetical protein
MDVTRSGRTGAVTERRDVFAPTVQNGSFQEQLQAAQGGGAASPAASESGPAASSGSGSSAPGRYAGANITYDGQSVTFEQLPVKLQQQMREQEESWAKAEAYRKRVAADPNIGPAAKSQPYDASIHEEAMAGLAMFDPAAAKMTPEQYYNYIGSDRAKYDTVLHAADRPVTEPGKRIFSPDLEQESKIQMVRDFRSAGTSLPDTYAEFERAWQADVARQATLQEERRKLLDL